MAKVGRRQPAARSAGEGGVRRGFPPTEKGVVSLPRKRVWRIAKRFATPPRGGSAPHPRNAGSRCAFLPGGRDAGACPRGDSLSARTTQGSGGAKRRGRGCGEGFPSHGKGCGESRSDSPHLPEGVAPRIRGMQGAGVLSYRVGAMPELALGEIPFRRGQRRGLAARSAGGGGVGRGFPSPQKRVWRIAKRFATPPRGVSAPHPKNAGSGCPFVPGGAMRGACPSGS